jgi:hypothetical protein
MKTTWTAAIVLTMLLIFASTAGAYINPNFTPINLVEQSETILLLEFTSAKDGKAVAKVAKVLKGKFADKELTIDVSACAFPNQSQAILDRINEGQKQAMFFVGAFKPEAEGSSGGGGGGNPGDEKPQGFMHLGGWWIRLEGTDKPANWDLKDRWEFLLGTWSGATDMLLRCINYIQAEKEPSAAFVPVDEGVSWAKEIRVAEKIDGKVVAAAPVDLEGKGRADLFVACEAGDKLFRLNGEKGEDLTAKVKLTSKSQAFAWADFNRDGKIDLASWDGKDLTIYYSQGADGTFAAKVCKTDPALKDVLGLAILDYADKGQPGLLVSTKAAPLLVMFQADGSVKTKALLSGEFPGKDIDLKSLGEPCRCLVADFDGDGLPDIIQLFVKAGLFYKGKGPAEFAAPVKTEACTRAARYDVCVADFDQDGLPDIFVGSDERNPLWQNLGGGKFAETLNTSGEISYHPKPGVVAVRAGDFANSGRQGLLVVYGSEMFPQIFYNRGWRSFAQSMKIDLAEQGLLKQAGQGQQAGCLGDFNGDGAMDLALVLKNGEAWIFPREVGKEPVLAATVSLSVASPSAGPVNVQAWADKEPLGSWTICAGDPPAIVGVRLAGTPLTLKWQFPGGQQQTKEIMVKNQMVRVVLDKK